MNWPPFASLLLLDFAVVFLAVLLGTRVVLGLFRRRNILDHPNPRSSHSTPTPHGGGIAVIAVVLVNWGVFSFSSPSGPAEILTLCGLAAALAVLSGLDDFYSLPVVLRLAVQAAAVTVVLWPAGESVFFQGLLPAPLDHIAAGLLWVWFINLFNFMDGIDGLAASESASIAIGFFLVVVLIGNRGISDVYLFYSSSIAAAVLGFLWWNWHPAKIFLGDVGSIPLGFLIGWLLLILAERGFWLPALILPLYYFSDATLTLVRRILRREKFWQAHRQHFYQLAVQRGMSHGAAVRAVIFANVLLIALAILSVYGWPNLSLGGAGIVVGILLLHLSLGRGKKASSR
ncbi:MAG: glycosyltransferase family 4 protein [Rhodospirillales bacterium]|nr:glycosyltransferase family 4 protein [Rhodospirillales bacterium]